MADFYKLSSNIAKGKLPAEHWNQFFIEYKSRTNRLAGTQFALNFVSLMMDDHLWQEKELTVLGEEFLEFVSMCQKAEFSSELETKFDEYRGRLKNAMECLVAYNDSFMIYQYVLNLYKYKFEDYEYTDYNDEEFTKELINYIISDKDQSNIRYKTMDVLKSLPIRMTKNRFFEMVKDGYSVYKGGSMETLKSFDYMLRSAALISTPENMDVNFPALYEYNEHFKTLDIEGLDSEGYYNESMALTESIDYLNSHISSCQLLAEGVNQLYAFVLTSDSAEKNHFDHINRIINKANIGVPLDGFEPDEELEIELANLEGIQEEEMEALMQADGCMDDICGTTFAAASGVSIQSEFAMTDKLRLLVSSSYFADLDGDVDDEDVSEVKMAELYKSFKDDLTEMFTRCSKPMTRALMSSCIGCIPMNFSNKQELHEYIYNSLSACTNMAEKMALVEQLEALMDSDLDWGE